MKSERSIFSYNFGIAYVIYTRHHWACVIVSGQVNEAKNTREFIINWVRLSVRNINTWEYSLKTFSAGLHRFSKNAGAMAWSKFQTFWSDMWTSLLSSDVWSVYVYANWYRLLLCRNAIIMLTILGVSVKRLVPGWNDGRDLCTPLTGVPVPSNRPANSPASRHYGLRNWTRSSADLQCQRRSSKLPISTAWRQSKTRDLHTGRVLTTC